MGRKRWAERRGRQAQGQRLLAGPLLDEATERIHTPNLIRCGFPYGDGSMCMAPASTEHAATHEGPTPIAVARFANAANLTEAEAARITADVTEAFEAERSATERQLNEATAKAPAGSGAPAGHMSPSLYRDLTGREYPPAVRSQARRPATYAALKEASAERAQFTTDQAQAMLSAALGTRPHLAARVIDKLGPVLAGELARAVDGAVNGRINKYLADEKATLDQLYEGAAAKLQLERENRGRSANAERWTTPSRLS